MDSKILDYEDGLYRFTGLKDLYEKFLKDFLKDKTFSEVKKAFQKNNLEDLKRSVHTLKGISGNLSLQRLFLVTDELMTYLRKEEKIISNKMFDRLQMAYDEAIAEIKKL